VLPRVTRPGSRPKSAGRPKRTPSGRVEWSSWTSPRPVSRGGAARAALVEHIETLERPGPSPGAPSRDASSAAGSATWPGSSMLAGEARAYRARKIGLSHLAGARSLSGPGAAPPPTSPPESPGGFLVDHVRPSSPPRQSSGLSRPPCGAGSATGALRVERTPTRLPHDAASMKTWSPSTAWNRGAAKPPE